MIPLRDINPTRVTPWATSVLVVANVVVFVFQMTLGPDAVQQLALSAGAIPFEIAHLVDLVGLDPASGLLHPASLIPIPLTLFSSLFMHGSLLHLLGNMWFLWLFGDNVEERLGWFRFFAFYLAAGLIGALAHVALDPANRIPMIGASGAVAGILGAYWVAFPRAQIITLIPPFFWFVPVRAWLFLGIWFVGQFFIGAAAGIAWMAHVGGFVFGVVAIKRLQRPFVEVIAAHEMQYIPPEKSPGPRR